MAPVQDSVLAGFGALLGMGALFMTQSVLPLLPTVHEMLVCAATAHKQPAT